MQAASTHKPRPMVDLMVSLVIPSVILMKLSGDEHLGATTALMVALAFPLGWGLFELVKYRQFNFIALLGLISVILTGGIGLLKLDPQYRLLPVDFGDVCLNYDKAWFRDRGLEPPHSLEDLIKPEFKGLTVVQNPATSSPGMAFLLTTVGRFGENGYLDFWKKLRSNDVYITSGWSDAYYGQFSRYKGGTRPIVVSYASSPPVEVYFSEETFDEAPTGVVLADGSGFRQVEFVGILKGTANRDLAEAWVDYTLDTTF